MFTLFRRRLTRLTTLRTRLYSTRPAFNPSQSFKLTDPPNPNWKLGQGLSNEGVGAKEWKEDEKLGWRTWDLSQMEKKFVICVVLCFFACADILQRSLSAVDQRRGTPSNRFHVYAMS